MRYDEYPISAAFILPVPNFIFDLSTLTQVAAMQSGNTTDAFGGNLLGSFVQVISFDASSDFVDKKISTNIAGGFSSGWINSIYATQDFAATLSVGSTYNARTNYWDQATFILGFDISSPISKPFSYAEIPGSPLNQYSADLYEGHLRVVTTEWFWSDTTSTSTTTNKIFVLKVPKSGEGSTMTLTGETDHVGKPNESIMSVRFMGDKGYVVTYLRKDPFYVYDLSNPSKPKKMGELEIPGYSSYLHPIEIDGVPLMLGIGMNVNETTGWETGVKISLFDVTDPTTLRVNATYVDEGAYSSAG
jgi:DNA excision repair protein ERCC-4